MRSKYIPSGRLALLLVAPLVLSAASLFSATLIWAALAVDLGIALLAAVDAVLARRALVTSSRSTPDIWSVGRSNPVTLTLRLVDTARLHATSLPVHYHLGLFEYSDAAGLPGHVTLRPGEATTVTVGIVPTRRGRFELGDTTVRYPSPLGLWSRQLTFSEHSPVNVYPDVRAVNAYELLARQDRERALLRPSPQRGGESEFDALRDYRKGDEYRAIDWRATARKQTLVARQYRLEQDQNIFFLIDAGRLMTAEATGRSEKDSGALSYFDHALNASLLLGHVASRAGDRVGAATFTSQLQTYTAPISGSRAVRALVRSLYATMPDYVEPDFERAFREVGTRIRRRSLVVLFTQVSDPVTAEAILRTSRVFLRRHLLLCVMFRDPRVETLAVHGAEPGSEAVREGSMGAAVTRSGRSADKDIPYVRAAAAQTLNERAQLLRSLRHAGALVLDVVADELTPALVDRYLDVKSRRLI